MKWTKEKVIPIAIGSVLFFSLLGVTIYSNLAKSQPQVEPAAIENSQVEDEGSGESTDTTQTSTDTQEAHFDFDKAAKLVYNIPSNYTHNLDGLTQLEQDAKSLNITVGESVKGVFTHYTSGSVIVAASTVDKTYVKQDDGTYLFTIKVARATSPIGNESAAKVQKNAQKQLKNGVFDENYYTTINFVLTLGNDSANLECTTPDWYL